MNGSDSSSQIPDPSAFLPSSPLIEGLLPACPFPTYDFFSSPHQNNAEGKYYHTFPERKDKMTQKDETLSIRCRSSASSLVFPFPSSPHRTGGALGSDWLAGLSQLISLLKPQFPHLESGANVITHLMALLQDEPIIHGKSQTQHSHALTIILCIAFYPVEPCWRTWVKQCAAQSLGKEKMDLEHVLSGQRWKGDRGKQAHLRVSR